METVNNNNNRATLNTTATGLAAKFAEIAVAIKAYAKAHDYKLNGLDGESGLLALENVAPNVFQLMSQNARKKTARRFRRFELHPTMSNANKMLAYLHKNAAEAISTFKAPKAMLKVGDKELAIRKARAEFVAARDAFFAAKTSYLATKGDFYKTK